MGGGGWAASWGAQDDSSSIAALRHAARVGVNWIDTAAAYGLGHAEEIVAKALSDLSGSERPLVFTKCGRVWSESDRLAPLTGDLRPSSVRRECEASLRRLGVGQIDLYQFHEPDGVTGTAVEDSWGEMSRLVEEGKVRFAGLSNYDTGQLERCDRIMHVDSLQPPFSLITRDPAADVIPWCAAHGTGVIVYSPLQAGLLTDGFSVARAEAMEPGDWRRRAKEFQAPRLSRNLALRDSLRPVAVRHGVPVAAVALAWVLAWPGVSGAIVGSRSPAQVDGWSDAGGLNLTPEDGAEIARAIESSGAGSGPISSDSDV
jgi:aryl-alcohol dehydrogenase-like predicted oxidoreductase